MTDKVYTARIYYHDHCQEIRNNSKEKSFETLNEAKEWLKTEIQQIHDDDYLKFLVAKIINGNETIILYSKVIYSFVFEEEDIEFKME
jgi:hypothetical protein